VRRLTGDFAGAAEALGERRKAMAAHGERERLQANHVAGLAGRAARLRAAFHEQPGFP